MSLHRPELHVLFRSGILRLAFLLAISTLLAKIASASIWDSKPFMQWTWADAARVLDASPWVSALDVSTGSSRSYWEQVASFLNPLTLPGIQKYRNNESPDLQDQYCARLLTARPVREAYLRFVSLVPGQTGGVSLEQLRRESSADCEQLRLKRFLSSNPDDIRSRGSDDRLIVSITTTRRSYLYNRTINIIGVAEFLKTEAHPDGFMNLRFPALAPVTFLTTKTGKKVRLEGYEPPGADNLGAKFYFPRFLPDGRPLVTLDDKELRFESRINDKLIAARFEPKRLLWQGKLEF